jgi:phosphoglycerate kinase
MQPTPFCFVAPLFRSDSICFASAPTNSVATAKALLDLAASKKVQIVLPSDVVIAKEFKNETEFKTVPVDAIPDGWMALDIGPKSVADIQAALKPAKTVVCCSLLVALVSVDSLCRTLCCDQFWNGPMGVFEFSNFSQGTLEVAKAIAAYVTCFGMSLFA